MPIKSILFISLFFFASITNAQINSFYVAPIDTDTGYEASQDSHLVVRNNMSTIDKLVLFLGGTDTRPRTYRNFSDSIATIGFNVINLSYVNDVAAAALTNSTDPLVFDKYRQEICYGTPESIFLQVDSLNAIYTRTLRLIQFLDTTFPSENWGQYLLNNHEIDWSKIIVTGHSQGSGHAAYIAKDHLVNRVLMFSGPNDYSNHFSDAANWLKVAGQTPVDRHYAYLSLLDEFVDFEKQLSSLESLQMYPTYDTVYVDNISEPYDYSHCLYTTQSPGFSLFHHSSPIKSSSINTAVWTYMLESIVSTTEDNVSKKSMQVFPNPTSSIIHILASDEFKSQQLHIYNTKGSLVKSGYLSCTNQCSIDLSDLPNGMYFLHLENQIIKLLKI